MVKAGNGCFVRQPHLLTKVVTTIFILTIAAYFFTTTCMAESHSTFVPVSSMEDLTSKDMSAKSLLEEAEAKESPKGPIVILHTESEQPPGECNVGSENDKSTSAERDQTPYIRNSLARAVYMKMKEDENNKNDRHAYWYRVIVSRLSPALQEKFVEFEQDEKTEEFLEHCVDLSNEMFTQLFHTVARTVLKLFMTQTSINGYLHRGSMFIFSSHHIEKLLRIPSYHKGDNLLDLGAGDGKVTKVLAQYYRNTFATEISSVMVKRLKSHGFSVLGIEEWQDNGQQYDLISCLNLLDRCDRPMKLLADMRASLAPGGRVLLAVVIPFNPYVEFESETHEPTERIRVKGANFEEEVEQFYRLFQQSGFTMEAFTRLPYLCEGDIHHSFYVLSDAVFVLKRTEDVSSS